MTQTASASAPPIALTREAWLYLATNALIEEVFEPAGLTIPVDRVLLSVGIPATNGRSGKRVGECWGASTHVDGSITGVNHIFISPLLESTTDVLETLAHELIHAKDNNASNHGKAFKRMALAIGFEEPMTSTPAGPALAAKLAELAKELPEYPHKKLVPAPTKKQTTRNLKLECPECGYVCRTTRKWLDQYNRFPCPCGTDMEIPEGESE